MSVDILITGRVTRNPASKVGKNGNPYCNWMMQAADKDGDYLTASCISFKPDVLTTMQAMGEGDCVSVSGEAAISTWEAKDGTPRTGLSILVHAVVTPYHVTRKRQATQHGGGEY